MTLRLLKRRTTGLERRGARSRATRRCLLVKNPALYCRNKLDEISVLQFDATCVAIVKLGKRSVASMASVMRPPKFAGQLFFWRHLPLSLSRFKAETLLFVEPAVLCHRHEA